MFFLQVVGAPVVVTLVGEPVRVLSIPKFLLEDFAVWGSRLQSEQQSAALKGLNPQQQAEFLTLYPPVFPTVDELRRSAQTPAGIEFIVRTCLEKASVSTEQGEPLPKLTAPEIKAITSGNHRMLATLAAELADLNDRSFIKPPTDTKAKKEQDSPLTGTEQRP